MDGSCATIRISTRAEELVLDEAAFNCTEATRAPLRRDRLLDYVEETMRDLRAIVATARCCS